jgi:uncharacterized repeat protein (TIGR01451 family)
MAVACSMSGVLGESASAVKGGAPRWMVTSVSMPTNFAPGDESGDDVYTVRVTNVGGAETDGSPVTVTDVLPEGLSLDHTGAKGFESRGRIERQEPGTALSCEGVTCTFSGKVIPQETLIVTFPVDVELTEPTSVTNVVRVAGGGAPDVSVSTPTAISSAEAGFGIAPGSTASSLSTTQAGAHADLTVNLGFNTRDHEGKLAGGEPKEIVADLPPGFSGDLVDTPACSVAVFSLHECPISTQIGVMTDTFAAGVVNVVPVYNLSPSPGEVGKIGFFIITVDVQGEVSVRPHDYGLETKFQDIKAAAFELDSTSLTVWGDPSDPLHNPWRWNGEPSTLGGFGASSPTAQVPYLASPTSCSGSPLSVKLTALSWQEPNPNQAVNAEAAFGPLSGCDRLTLPSTFTAVPTTTNAYAPTGLNVEMGVHQTNENPEGLATSALQKAVVTLPEGMTVNPSSGAGLGACTVQEFEDEGRQFVPGVGCPSDSKLGSVRIKTPALNEEATGSVFIAQQYANPFGSLIALYVVARFPVRGVLVKVAGRVEANPLTGQLVTTFEGIPTVFEGLPPQEGLPPVPFSVFKFSFRQGETSPLVTPPACGSYAAMAELTPWSNPLADLSEVSIDPSLPFEITNSFDGGACPAGGVPPFNPQVYAGTLDNNAGSYSPFDLRITRGDGEQEITGFSSQMPPGLTASLTGVPFCSEAQIALARTKTGGQEEAEPSCPAASQIGHTLVGAGVGSVLAYASGKIYMAGPFEGAPFSIAAITSAKVGPFDLGTVVVHLPLQINPVTAVVSVAAGGADQIPHIIKGIVVHVRDIRVYIDRPNFTINPTSCSPMAFTASVIGSGASFTSSTDDVPVTVSDPFQAADCANLAFKPSFKGSMSSKTSKANGANLTFSLTYPKAPQGTQANIAKVKVELPKQLPSRLSTLQKACTDSVFNANPANCPAASMVATATAITPILPVPLTGPAYFVSHGGAKFPELIFVLQGYGVTLDLHSETFISKKGITSGTFRTVPDDPVGSFEVKFPQGPHSAFAANGNVCKEKLTAPTTFTAQNGTIIHQNTPINPTGCPKHTHKHTTTHKHKH